MKNEVAPEGAVWVCGACGKRSKDLYGYQRIDKWWDESCVMHAVLCKEEGLKFGEHGRVVYADPYKEEEDENTDDGI